MALTAPRKTDRLLDGKRTYPQKGSTTVYQGSLCVLDSSGYCKMATAATGLIGCGVAKSNQGQGSFVNGGSDGASNVEVEEGVFGFDNSAGDALTAADIGKICYIEDDHTVAATSASDTLSAAGRVVAIDSDGQVFVHVSAQLSRAIVDEPAPSPINSYTQTYTTANRTVANPTAATLTVADGAGTNDNTIDAITNNASTIAAVQELADEINKLVADHLDNKQTLTALIDDLQAAGILS